MDKMTKEQLQKEANNKRIIREKQIAQLKASNDMLEATKAGIIKRYGENSDTANKLIEDVDVAIRQNYEKAESHLNANADEVNAAVYNEPTKEEVEAYEKRLAARGITDEEIHKKSFDADTTSVEETEQTPLQKLKGKLKNLKTKNVLESEDKISHGLMEDKISHGLMSDDDFNKLMMEKNSDIENVPLSDKDNKKIENNNEDVTVEVEQPTANVTKEYTNDVKDFDPRDIPPEIMYDIIPLPSNGECYAHKKKCLPVAYLTAADENLIASPNLYNNGNLLDIILERKILDKSIRVQDLCSGDRDAIVIWLRATAYDTLFPVNARNPETGKTYKTKVDLSKLTYKPFNLKGDENGYFDYTTENGDLIKFKMLSKGDQQKLIEDTFSKYSVINKRQLGIMTNELRKYINDLDFYEGYDSAIEAIDIINDWIDTIKAENNVDIDAAYTNSVTNRMIAHTCSINGEKNPNFIKSYIENMRTKEAIKYRTYIDDNIPGVNLKIKVNIPESDGGGSFESFLGIYDTIFLSV